MSNDHLENIRSSSSSPSSSGSEKESGAEGTRSLSLKSLSDYASEEEDKRIIPNGHHSSRANVQMQAAKANDQ